MQVKDGESLITDGPFTEGKEHLGGFTIIKAADLDVALEWGRKLATRALAAVNRGAAIPGRVDALSDRPTLSTAEIERVFREEYGRAVAVLVRRFGDIDVAEEAVQDAFATAVQRWTSDGLPPSPAGWIITTARNRIIDRVRREASRDDRHAQATWMHGRDDMSKRGGRLQTALAHGSGASSEPDEEEIVRDERLRLIFTCCHPALALNVSGRADAAPARRAHH